MTAQGIPAVRLPRKYANMSKSFLEMPPFAIMIPDRTNIGTARSGKESRPPNMARIKYFAPTVKDGSQTDGRTDVIPSVMDTGIAMISPMTKMINNNATGIYGTSLPEFLILRIRLSMLVSVAESVSALA